jgi:hypothetical protein
MPISLFHQGAISGCVPRLSGAFCWTMRASARSPSEAADTLHVLLDELLLLVADTRGIPSDGPGSGDRCTGPDQRRKSPVMKLRYFGGVGSENRRSKQHVDPTDFNRSLARYKSKWTTPGLSANRK